MRRGKKILLAATILMAGVSVALLFRKTDSPAETAEPAAVAKAPARPDVTATPRPTLEPETPAPARPADVSMEPNREPDHVRTAPGDRLPSWAVPADSGPLKPLFPSTALGESPPPSNADRRPVSPAARPPVDQPPLERPAGRQAVDRTPVTQEANAGRAALRPDTQQAPAVEPAAQRRRPAPAVLPPAETSREVTATAVVHTVRDGDNLASLARRYLGSAQRASEIFEANRKLLKSPDVLPIGARLKIPAKPARTAPLQDQPERPLVPITPFQVD